jgi:hypothetical protein
MHREGKRLSERTCPGGEYSGFIRSQTHHPLRLRRRQFAHYGERRRAGRQLSGRELLLGYPPPNGGGEALRIDEDHFGPAHAYEPVFPEQMRDVRKLDAIVEYQGQSMMDCYCGNQGILRTDAATTGLQIGTNHCRLSC